MLVWLGFSCLCDYLAIGSYQDTDTVVPFYCLVNCDACVFRFLQFKNTNASYNITNVWTETLNLPYGMFLCEYHQNGIPPFQTVGRFRPNLSSLHQVYRKMHKHLKHQTRFTGYTLKFILIAGLFDIVNDNTFFSKLGQN